MKAQDYKKLDIPTEPGVYLFKKGKTILYIGKATSLRTRTRSYFDTRLIQTRGLLVLNMVDEADALEWTVTDSALEALILEAKIIRKYHPKFNSIGKDDKSFYFVEITKDPFPQILLERGAGTYGPFTSGPTIREALKIIRRIFPYNTHDLEKHKTQNTKLQNNRGCFDYQIGLCPGTCIGAITKQQYAKTVRKIKLIFDGQKSRVLSGLEKEMLMSSKSENFELASRLKRQIDSLKHIHDISLIKNEYSQATSYHLQSTLRIEAYDIAHISGSATVGVMTVVEEGQPKKSDYRKFKIKGSAEGIVDDVRHLKEILRRRLMHLEWPLPNLIVVDGALPQKNTAETLLKEKGFNIPVVAVTKDEKHKPREIVAENDLARMYNKEILLANAEAHRFAIEFHRKTLRKKGYSK